MSWGPSFRQTLNHSSSLETCFQFHHYSVLKPTDTMDVRPITISFVFKSPILLRFLYIDKAYPHGTLSKMSPLVDLITSPWK